MTPVIPKPKESVREQLLDACKWALDEFSLLASRSANFEEHAEIMEKLRDAIRRGREGE